MDWASKEGEHEIYKDFALQMKKFGLASPERERVGRLILTRLSKLGMDERDVPQNFVRLPHGRLWAPTMRNVKICEKGATLFESYPLWGNNCRCEQNR